MFLLWFLIAGVVIGLLRKGRIYRLERLHLRGPWLVAVTLIIQLLIFPWGERDPLVKVGTGYLHLVSYVPLLMFVCLNRRYWELSLIGIGILCNLIVIAANGGYMPVSEFALRQAGRDDLAAFLRQARTSGNVILMTPDTKLNFLGDVLFLPPWIPFAAAFSIGDLLLGMGLLAFLVARENGAVRRKDWDSREFYLALLEKLAQAETVSQIAQIALRHAVNLLPHAEAGSFLFWDEGEGVYKYVAAEGWNLEELKEICFKPDELLPTKLGKTEEICIIKDPWALFQRYAPHMLDKFKEPRRLPTVFVSVPIRYRDMVVGYFNIDGKRPNAFTPQDLRVLQEFQRTIELALSLHLNHRELQENEQRLRVLFDNAPDAIYIIDYQGNILDCNKAATEQTGYTKEELLRMNIARDLAVDPPFAESIKEKLERGERVVFEEKKRRKGGDIFYTEVAVSPLMYHGRRVALSFNRDITWRKKYEDKIYQLWRLSRDLLSNHNEEEIVRKAVHFCTELFETPCCGIYLFRDGAYRLTASHRSPGLSLRLPESISSVTELAIDEAPRSHLIITPIGFAERRLGALVVVTQGEASEYQKRLAELLALQVATALQTAGYTQRLKEFADRLEKLHHAAMRFHQLTDEKEMCAVALELLEKLMGFHYCSIDLVEGEYLVPICYLSKISSITPRRFRIDEGISGLTFREGRTFWGDDVRKVPEAKPVNPDIRSYISVPIGEYGVIQIVSKEVGAFSMEDVRLVEILAQQMYEGIKRARLEREIREQAVKDPLTGLYNRRYFDLFVELHRRKSGDEALSLAILDMDGFKAVNDRFGHTVGDEVLVAVANLLKENVRSEDVIIRWGGDEFLILMPKTSIEEARKAVERLRKVVASWTHPRHPEVRLSFTAGIAAWIPSEGGVDEALRAADEELYVRRGRRERNPPLQSRDEGRE